jgi:hypothetical protein
MVWDKGVLTKRSNISLNCHARNASEVDYELHLWSIGVQLNHKLGMSRLRNRIDKDNTHANQVLWLEKLVTMQIVGP